MRYIVIGAGAIGGTIGGRLAAGGHEVVLVARGAHLDALRASGPDAWPPRTARPRWTSPPSAGPGELDLREDDVLLLATKTQDAEPLLADWAWQPVRNSTVDARRDALPVVCAQNGVASERIALRRFRQVYGMCVWLPATHLEPGVVEANGAPLAGLLHIGRYPSGADATAEQIGADLTASGFLAPVIRGRDAVEVRQAAGQPEQRDRGGVRPRRLAARDRAAPPGDRRRARGARRGRHRLRPRTRRAPSSAPTGCRSCRSTGPNGSAVRPGRA